MILVAGATGNAGGAVVRALVAAGLTPRALVRPGSDTSGLPPEAEPVTGDLNSPESLRPHLAGVEAVFMLSGYEGLAETLAAMLEAGVSRVVLLSSSAAPDRDMDNAIARYHVLSEDAVRESGLAWTFLQPNSLMSNTLRWRPQLEKGDVVRLPFAGVPIATIHPDDLGAVAVAALTDPAHEGRAYRLSGPQSLLPEEQVRILAAATGRDLRFEAQPDEEARAEMTAQMPAEYVEAFFKFFVDGDLNESDVLPTVAEVTGREPRTFEEWARENAEAFIA